MDRGTTAPMTITLRAAAALPAAGAWDAAPLVLQTFNCEWLTLFLTYTQGAALGAVDFQLSVSPYLADIATVQNWFPVSLYAAGVLAAGADTQSRIQREFITYQSTAAGAETFLYGPIRIGRNVARVRVACRESGVVLNPGAAHIVGALGY